MKIREKTFNTYWYFASERQNIFFKKLKGEKPPYSDDPIFQEFKFCCSYRASDRVSQYLIKDVIYADTFSEEDTMMRILLFRLLNKNETWEALEKKLGDRISLKNFDPKTYTQLLDKIKIENKNIYGNAFILAPTKIYGFTKKQDNHLALIEDIFVKRRIGKSLFQTKSLEDLYNALHELPMIGNFMAYQIAIDLNYSEVYNYSENDFTMPGPGAMRGIAKCFESIDGMSEKDIIFYMVEHQDEEFQRLGIDFQSLWGRKLSAIDCQGLFCETDKYSRQKFPELKSNRSRIKETYKKSKGYIEYFYPPKWGINDKVQKTQSDCPQTEIITEPLFTLLS